MFYIFVYLSTNTSDTRIYGFLFKNVFQLTQQLRFIKNGSVVLEIHKGIHKYFKLHFTIHVSSRASQGRMGVKYTRVIRNGTPACAL